MTKVDAGHGILTQNASWTFSGDTPKEFINHAQSSIPNYDQGHELCLDLSDYFLGSNGVCFDIGCSVGNLSKKIAERHIEKNILVNAIDIEQDMINFAETTNSHSNINYQCGNALEIEMKNSSFTYAYYTVQFVSPSFRQTLINTIYNSLNWGGGFLMFEKVRAPDARFQDYMSQLYMEFKLKNKFTPDNIIAKQRSLKNILEPFSTNANIDMLKRAGFSDVMSIYKFICFEGFLAIK